MKSTGIVRKVDELGRISVPKELRDVRGIDKGTPLEIFVEGDSIILQKYNPGCVICGEVENTAIVDGVRICHKCATKALNS